MFAGSKTWQTNYSMVTAGKSPVQLVAIDADGCNLTDNGFEHLSKFTVTQLPRCSLV